MHIRAWFSDDCYYSYSDKTIHKNNKLLKELTGYEYKVLEYFIENADISCSNEAILNGVWGEYVTDIKGEDIYQRVRYYIKRINDINDCSINIENKRGVGYCLRNVKIEDVHKDEEYQYSKNDSIGEEYYEEELTFSNLCERIYHKSIEYREAFGSGVQEGIVETTSGLHDLLRELYYFAEETSLSNKVLSKKALLVIDQYNKYAHIYNAFISFSDRVGDMAQYHAKLAEKEFEIFIDILLKEIDNNNKGGNYIRLVDELGVDNSLVDMPREYSFLKMLGVSDVSDIDILHLREKNDFIRSLSVPIGINNEGKVTCFDLHRNWDGPNGLIIGPDCSGKSEFIITLCLSLGLNFSPQEVCVFLFDIDGGYATNQLMDFPNLKEVIIKNNLESVNIFIDNLHEEINSRIALLKKYRVSNVDKYNEMCISEGISDILPHIIIIIDELKELKYESPSSLKMLMEWVKKGDNLGLHLIISTGYYYGLIDDYIWNMSDFKMCLSMQKDVVPYSELQDMACPGRLYFQSKKNNKVQIIQIAYSHNEDINSKMFKGFFVSLSEKKQIIDLINQYQSKGISDRNVGKYILWNEEESFNLKVGKNTIGREKSTCDFYIHEVAVSRIHAMIVVSEESVQIVDLGAINGTYVNGKKLARKEKKYINVGDVVRFGNTSYELIKIK